MASPVAGVTYDEGDTDYVKPEGALEQGDNLYSEILEILAFSPVLL